MKQQEYSSNFEFMEAVSEVVLKIVLTRVFVHGHAISGCSTLTSSEKQKFNS